MNKYFAIMFGAFAFTSSSHCASSEFAEPTVDKEILLCEAVMDEQVDTVSALLKDGARADTRISLESTLLHATTMHDDDIIATLLLAAGADVNAQNVLGFTPLRLAASEDRVKVARVLLRNGADINVKDKSGETLLKTDLKRNKINVVREMLTRLVNIKSIIFDSLDLHSQTVRNNSFVSIRHSFRTETELPEVLIDLIMNMAAGNMRRG